MTHELDGLSEVSRFSNAELVCRLERLVKADRALSAKLLVHLGEVEERGLFRDLGYSSMFEYCRSALRMSEAEAYLRLQAARFGRRFPLVLERVGAGDLNLSAIKLIAPLLTAENHVELLDRVRGKTKREVERLVAELAPKPDVVARLRRLPAAREAAAIAIPASASAPQACSSTALALSAAPVSTVPQSAAAVVQTAPSGSFALRSPQARARVTPLSPGRFKLVLTLGQEAHDKLEQLRELFRHQNPSGDPASIVERALSELLERSLKRRFAQTSVPERRRARRESSKPSVRAKAAVKASAEAQSDTKGKTRSSASRYIPRKVLREVYARDGGQCFFVSADGRRCSSRGFLEVHHHDSTFARGGEATTENLRLACRVHNLLLAERDYGRGFMQEKLRTRRDALVPEIPERAQL